MCMGLVLGGFEEGKSIPRTWGLYLVVLRSANPYLVHVYMGLVLGGFEEGKSIPRANLGGGSSLGRYVFGSEISYNKPPPPACLG